MTQFSDVVRTLQQWMAERGMVPTEPVVLVLDTPSPHHANALQAHIYRDMAGMSRHLANLNVLRGRIEMTVLGMEVVVTVQGRPVR